MAQGILLAPVSPIIISTQDANMASSKISDSLSPQLGPSSSPQQQHQATPAAEQPSSPSRMLQERNNNTPPSTGPSPAAPRSTGPNITPPSSATSAGKVPVRSFELPQEQRAPVRHLFPDASATKTPTHATARPASRPYSTTSASPTQQRACEGEGAAGSARHSPNSTPGEAAMLPKLLQRLCTPPSPSTMSQFARQQQAPVAPQPKTSPSSIGTSSSSLLRQPAPAAAEGNGDTLAFTIPPAGPTQPAWAPFSKLSPTALGRQHTASSSTAAEGKTMPGNGDIMTSQQSNQDMIAHLKQLRQPSAAPSSGPVIISRFAGSRLSAAEASGCAARDSSLSPPDTRYKGYGPEVSTSPCRLRSRPDAYDLLPQQAVLRQRNSSSTQQERDAEKDADDGAADPTAYGCSDEDDDDEPSCQGKPRMWDNPLFGDHPQQQHKQQQKAQRSTAAAAAATAQPSKQLRFNITELQALEQLLQHSSLAPAQVQQLEGIAYKRISSSAAGHMAHTSHSSISKQQEDGTPVASPGKQPHSQSSMQELLAQVQRGSLTALQVTDLLVSFMQQQTQQRPAQEAAVEAGSKPVSKPALPPPKAPPPPPKIGPARPASTAAAKGGAPPPPPPPPGPGSPLKPAPPQAAPSTPSSVSASAMVARLEEMCSGQEKPSAPAKPSQRSPQRNASKQLPGIPLLATLTAAKPTKADQILLPQESPKKLLTHSEQLASFMAQVSAAASSQADLITFVGGGDGKDSKGSKDGTVAGAR